MAEALSQARRLGQAHVLAHVLTMVNWFDDTIGLRQAHIEEVLALSREHGFAYYLGMALAHRGRLLISLGPAQEGLELLKQGLAEVRATGAVAYLPQLLTWLAEAHAVLRQPAEAMRCSAEAARIINATEERYAEAEYVHRVPGDLLSAAGDRAGAERHYRQAIAVAERQSAKFFQLKASTSLARLWRDQGERVEARSLLGPIYDWFTEGFDAPGLKDAKAVLDELG
jgi:tetratricopeptide (TPR) repeat protein